MCKKYYHKKVSINKQYKKNLAVIATLQILIKDLEKLVADYVIKASKEIIMEDKSIIVTDIINARADNLPVELAPVSQV
jgi:hypothetical protein